MCVFATVLTFGFRVQLKGHILSVFNVKQHLFLSFFLFSFFFSLLLDFLTVLMQVCSACDLKVAC